MADSRFAIKTGGDGQFYFTLHASNGEPILKSEGYTVKASCLNGVESVKANAPSDERYERMKASDGQFYFTLLAANHEVIGVSEMYTTVQSRDTGIEAVKRAAPAAVVVDKS